MGAGKREKCILGGLLSFPTTMLKCHRSGIIKREVCASSYQIGDQRASISLDVVMGLLWGLESSAIMPMTFKGNVRYFTAQTKSSYLSNPAASGQCQCCCKIGSFCVGELLVKHRELGNLF